MLACVITPPEGMLPPTSTICVECVQATICAENEDSTDCPLYATPTPPELESETPEITPTEDNMINETPDIEAIMTETAYASSSTPTRTEIIGFTATRTVTSTPTGTQTATITITPELFILPTLDMSSWVYKIQSGSPKYTTNFAHPDQGCAWSGIAGQVFGPLGVPQRDIVVVVTGDVNGVPYDLLGFTSSAVAYGASAYEVEFPYGPIRTNRLLSMQLFGLDGTPLTGEFPIDTYMDCDKNLIIYNFTLAN
jgi:hypothetical protein